MIRYIAKVIREEHRRKLVANKAIGHSFMFIKDSCYANSFIGDFTHPLNDNIASWIVKARCNMLLTGSKAIKMGLPEERRPHYPYCGVEEKDTLAHRINGCKHNRSELTKRHNNIQNIVMGYMKTRIGNNMHLLTNSTVNIEGKHIDEKFSSLKPDIISWNDKKLYIIEFSCPYDNVSSNGNTLNKTYETKVNKYKELVEECKRVYNKDTKYFVIIVSSLGAIHRKSIKALCKLLHISKNDTRTRDAILRRLSLASCIGSYFIFNKLKFKPIEVDTNNTNNDEETQEPEYDSQEENSQEHSDETEEDFGNSHNNNEISEEEDEQDTEFIKRKDVTEDEDYSEVEEYMNSSSTEETEGDDTEEEEIEEETSELHNGDEVSFNKDDALDECADIKYQ